MIIWRLKLRYDVWRTNYYVTNTFKFDVFWYFVQGILTFRILLVSWCNIIITMCFIMLKIWYFVTLKLLCLLCVKLMCVNYYVWNYWYYFEIIMLKIWYFVCSRNSVNIIVGVCKGTLCFIVLMILQPWILNYTKDKLIKANMPTVISNSTQ